MINRIALPIRTDDGGVRSSPSRPLPRVLPPVVLLDTWPQMGGHGAGNVSRLNVKLAIEAAMQCSDTQDARCLRVGLTAAT